MNDTELQQAIDRAVRLALKEPAVEAYTVVEFAKAYRVSTGWLYLNWRRPGGGEAPPYYWCGNRRMIARSTAEAWQRGREQERAQQHPAKEVENARRVRGEEWFAAYEARIKAAEEEDAPPAA